MLKREVQFLPGHDYREGYGWSGMSIRFLLRGEKGAVQFLLFTSWMPKDHLKDYDRAAAHLYPMGADVGYHSPLPRYEGQKPMDTCDVLPGNKCYYDGSTLRAEEYLRVLRREGHEPLEAA